MPLPWAYRHASKDWRAFLDDAREAFGLVSDNSTYTAVQGVLWTFRDRLTPAQVADFAQVLPAVLRAILIQGWRAQDPLPWEDMATLNEAARRVRVNHNLTPATPIPLVARCLRAHLRQSDLDACLARIGPEAERFWQVEDAEKIERRIV